MRKKCVQVLPSQYKATREIDLQKDRKTSLIVNICAVVVMLLLGIIGLLIKKPSFDDGMILRLIVLMFAYVAYIVAHEATHGLVMKVFGAKKLRFGFTGLYAYAGSKEDYFTRIPYMLIALAPVVIWGIIFGALCVILPATWFWTVYLLQIGNIAGAAGDLYVTGIMCRMPADCYVQDTGVSMTIYTSKE